MLATFKSAWSVIGGDVTKAIQYFFDSAHMPRIVNSAAITLVPKQDDPTKILQFRPISCCNVLYKCCAKMIAHRMKHVMPLLVSKNQSAFIPGRRIGDKSYRHNLSAGIIILILGPLELLLN